MKKELKYVIYVNSAPEAVWHALTSPEGTRAIFFGSELQSTFEIGAPYQYVGPGADGEQTVHVYGNILAFEPYAKMSYTEHPGPSYRDNHAELQTRVTLTLETVGETTKLTLVNDQWPDDHPSYESTENNWQMTMSAIKSYVETGKVLHFGW